MVVARICPALCLSTVEGGLSLGDRVYLLSHGFQPEYEVGFANGLGANGIDVTLVGSDQTLTGRLKHNVRVINLRGSQDESRSKLTKALNIIVYLFAYARLARHDQNAIFHFNGLFTLRRGWGVLLEALFARVVIKRWWLSVHNLLPHDQESKKNLFIFKWVYTLPDKLIVHTPVMQSELHRRFAVPLANIMVIEHGIDRFIPPDVESKAKLSKELSLPYHQRLILAFGNVAPYKGPLLLLDALLERCVDKSVLVLMVGKATSNEIETQIKEKAAKLPESVNFRWINAYVPDDLVPTLLGAADVMVLPYLKIDQSGVIFAAKSAGLPIIASDVGIFGKYIDTPLDQLIRTNDIDSLRSALARFCGKPQLTVEEKLGRINSARLKYSWDCTLKVYSDAVRESSKG